MQHLSLLLLSCLFAVFCAGQLYTSSLAIVLAGIFFWILSFSTLMVGLHSTVFGPVFVPTLIQTVGIVGVLWIIYAFIHHESTANATIGNPIVMNAGIIGLLLYLGLSATALVLPLSWPMVSILPSTISMLGWVALGINTLQCLMIVTNVRSNPYFKIPFLVKSNWSFFDLKMCGPTPDQRGYRSAEGPSFPGAKHSNVP
tara:strand:- start:779 stop:1378 length:600 start_codon:yes stop_codon:yes gene_type:complete